MSLCHWKAWTPREITAELQPSHRRTAHDPTSTLRSVSFVAILHRIRILLDCDGIAAGNARRCALSFRTSFRIKFGAPSETSTSYKLCMPSSHTAGAGACCLYAAPGRGFSLDAGLQRRDYNTFKQSSVRSCAPAHVRTILGVIDRK
jgi:hypothetical protein